MAREQGALPPPQFGLRTLVITAPGVVAVVSVAGMYVSRNLGAVGLAGQAALAAFVSLPIYLASISLGGYAAGRLARAFHVNETAESILVSAGAIAGAIAIFVLPQLLFARFAYL